MKSGSIKFFCLGVILLFGLVGSIGVSAQTQRPGRAAPKKHSPSAAHKKAIEKIVREYLLTHPAIVREALEALQAQEEEKAQRAVLPNLNAKRSEIYSDADSPSTVDRNSDVTLVVFFDYFCGYCRKALPELKEMLARDRSIGVIYKELPILGPQSDIAARAALAAHRQGKYAEFHQALLASDDVSEAAIKKISDDLGLDYRALQSDMNDPQVSAAIKRNYSLAESLHIEGTPAYIIGNRIIRGAIDPAALSKLITDERAKRTTGANRTREAHAPTGAGNE